MTSPESGNGFDVMEQRLLWDLACVAIRLLKQDPTGLRGMLVAASHGPVHQAFQTRLNESFKLVRLPITVSEDRLSGGLDINETLAQGRRVMQPGLLTTTEGALIIHGAERLDTTVAGILAAHVDADAHTGSTPRAPLIAIDESLDDEPGLASSALGDRLALMLPLPDLPLRDLQAAMDQQDDHDREAGEPAHSAAVCAQAATSEAIGCVSLPEEILMELTQLAAQLGITSLRPLVFASRVARGHAFLDGRTEVDLEDATVATRLVLAPRATCLPTSAPAEDTSDTPANDTEPNDSAENDTPSETDTQDNNADNVAPPPDNAPPLEEHQDDSEDPEKAASDTEPTMAEQLLQAASATLPQHLIADLVRGQKAGDTTGRDSTSSSAGTQGRPAGVRRPRGRGSRQRINLIETLKAAAPWQKLRGRTLGNGQTERLQVRLDDFRVTRFKQPTRTTTVFVVDASGSAALHRLAEAKGAVELLLAECYVRRDRVAMISFRGNSAALELPPTRSLVRAKRQLSGLPGGGGTPLAAGLDLACDVVRQLKQAGETPVIVLMTDGKANVNRRGEGSRTDAMADAESAARQLAMLSVRTLFVDTSPRARVQAAQLAEKMHARYLPLPPGGSVALPGMLQP